MKSDSNIKTDLKGSSDIPMKAVRIKWDAAMVRRCARKMDYITALAGITSGMENVPDDVSVHSNSLHSNEIDKILKGIQTPKHSITGIDQTKETESESVGNEQKPDMTSVSQNDYRANMPEVIDCQILQDGTDYRSIMRPERFMF